MYFPPPRCAYGDADTSVLKLEDGEIPFTQKFKYLGSLITSDLKEDAEIDSRIRAATAAFASIRSQFFSSKQIRTEHKRIAYEGIVMSILLYGCETWSLTCKLQRRLESFHNRCIRIMCRVTMWHVKEHRITSESLLSRVNMHPMAFYLARRRLRWGGHVYRMDQSRLPKKFLTAWVNHERPRGRPQYVYGHGLTRDLRNAGIDLATWETLAADEEMWHEITEQRDVHRKAKPQKYFRCVPRFSLSPLPPCSYASVLATGGPVAPGAVTRLNLSASFDTPAVPTPTSLSRSPTLSTPSAPFPPPPSDMSPSNASDSSSLFTGPGPDSESLTPNTTVTVTPGKQPVVLRRSARLAQKAKAAHAKSPGRYF